MKYTPPAGDAADFSWVGAQPYAPPLGRAANFTWAQARADLVFIKEPVAYYPADLIFEPDVPAEVSDEEYELSGGGQITGFPGRITARVGLPLTGPTAGSLLGFHGGMVTTSFDINVLRPTVGQVLSSYQEADDFLHGLDSSYQEGLDITTYRESRYQEGLSVEVGPSITWDTGASTYGTMLESLYQQAIPVRAGAQSDFQEALRSLRILRTSLYQEAVRAATQVDAGFQQALHVSRWYQSLYEEAMHLSAWASADYGYGLPMAIWRRSRYQEAMRPPIGKYPGGGTVTPEPDPCYLPLVPAMLRFLDPYAGGVARGDLEFWCERHPVDPTDPGIIIPALWTYIIVNTVSLKRVSDNIAIQFTSASVGIDNASWCWSFNAAISPHELEKVAPTDDGPVEVELEINGVKWKFIVEAYTDSSSFAKTTYTITGRSRSAYLDAPYAPTRSWVQDELLMSRQIAEAELSRPGLATGFTLDWDLAGSLGWEMPAGSYSFNEKTPIAVINEIVAGGGGYLNSHPYLPQLIARSLYPAPFWEWAAADLDFTIPRTFIKSQNLRWMEKPAYNGVRVSGQYTGVTGLYKRAGTDGAFTAPMVTSPFITHADAARNVGKSILSAGGKQSQVSLTMPMRASDGLITPGKLIEVVSGGIGTHPSWRGMVRATEVAVSWNAAPEVAQTITLERHYGDIT